MKIMISISAATAKDFTKGQRAALRVANNEWYAGTVTKVGRTKVYFQANDGEEYDIDGDDLKWLKPITKAGAKKPYTNADIKALFVPRGSVKPEPKIKDTRYRTPEELAAALGKPRKPKGLPPSSTKVTIAKPEAASPPSIWDQFEAKEKAMKKELAPIVKGLKLPGGAKAKFSMDGYSWSKRGGYADNVFKPIWDLLGKEHLGFKKVQQSKHDVPDGSAMSSGNVYSNGKFTLTIHTTYGSTAYDNYYSIYLRPIEPPAVTTTPSSTTEPKLKLEPIIKDTRYRTPEELQNAQRKGLKERAEAIMKEICNELKITQSPSYMTFETAKPPEAAYSVWMKNIPGIKPNKYWDTVHAILEPALLKVLGSDPKNKAEFNPRPFPGIKVEFDTAKLEVIHKL